MTNRVKLLLLGISLALPVLIVGLLVGWMVVRTVQGLMIITTIVFAIFSVVACGFYFFSDTVLLRWYRAKAVEDENTPLHEIVRRLAPKAGVPAPKVFIVESAMPNAFAIGRNAEHASIVVTNALLTALDTEELEAVLAHELAHLKNDDTLLGSIVAVLSGALTALTTVAFWGSIFTGFGQEDDPAPNLIHFFVTALVAPVAALLIQLMVSPSREYRADEESVRMTEKPHALISALEKLKSKLQSDTFNVNPSHVHLFFMNPLHGDEQIIMDLRLPTYRFLFRTHPSTEDRLTALREFQVGRTTKPKKVKEV
jgi:heat shock protein HtpX